MTQNAVCLTKQWILPQHAWPAEEDVFESYSSNKACISCLPHSPAVTNASIQLRVNYWKRKRHPVLPYRQKTTTSLHIVLEMCIHLILTGQKPFIINNFSQNKIQFSSFRRRKVAMLPVFNGLSLIWVSHSPHCSSVSSHIDLLCALWSVWIHAQWLTWKRGAQNEITCLN